jgi:hypothetical protein
MAKKAKKKAAKATKTVNAKKSAKVAKARKAPKAAVATRKPWTDTDMKAFKTLIKQNTPTRLIAMKLNRSVASVYTKARSAGISLAPTNRSPRD